jgi:hypothetical protein
MPILTYKGEKYEVFMRPRKSSRKEKKMMVGVKKIKTGQKRIIHFGQKGYKYFTQHKDIRRRRLYLSRSAKIKDRFGRLTKDNPFSANYWARRILW